MRVRIKNTQTALQALFNASVPKEVIYDIAGKVVEIDNKNHVESSAWLNEPIKWEIPTECFEAVAA